jgi:hypothetical protein
MYKLLQEKGKSLSMVLRVADNAFIPFDPANTDYQAYLKWVEAGNTPLPADE